MSYAELYLGSSGPLISGGTNDKHDVSKISDADNTKKSNVHNSQQQQHNNDKNQYSCSIFGVPFDATHSYKPGCRFGPDAIRTAFNNIEVFHPELGVDLESVQIHDMGNIPHTASTTQMLDMTRRVTKDLIKKDKPVFILGGEHLLTYGTYMAFPKNVAYVVFDAHYDLRNEYGDVTLNHATYLRRIVEECGSENILHIGARAFAAEELAFLKDMKIKHISNAEIASHQNDEKIHQILVDFLSSYDSMYASYDLDVLDPAFAPGVGNPEAEGITSRELFNMIRTISRSDVHIVGSDIVELNPTYDTGATSALAAKILSMMIAMTVQTQQ